MIVMFKNSVFNVSVDTKQWFKKAGVREVKTMAQPKERICSAMGTADRGARYIQDRRVHDLDRWNREETMAGTITSGKTHKGR